MWGLARSLLLISVGLFALGGCSLTPQEEYAKRIALEGEDDQFCQAQGLDQGSDTYFQCRIRVAQIRAEKQAQNARARRATGAAMQSAGAALMRQGSGR